MDPSITRSDRMEETFVGLRPPAAGWYSPVSAQSGEVTTAMLSVGSAAPAFKVKDDHGRDVSLADFKGKTVILWFYPKADTPG